MWYIAERSFLGAERSEAPKSEHRTRRSQPWSRGPGLATTRIESWAPGGTAEDPNMADVLEIALVGKDAARWVETHGAETAFTCGRTARFVAYDATHVAVGQAAKKHSHAIFTDPDAGLAVASFKSARRYACVHMRDTSCHDTIMDIAAAWTADRCTRCDATPSKTCRGEAVRATAAEFSEPHCAVEGCPMEVLSKHRICVSHARSTLKKTLLRWADCDGSPCDIGGCQARCCAPVCYNHLAAARIGAAGAKPKLAAAQVADAAAAPEEPAQLVYNCAYPECPAAAAARRTSSVCSEHLDLLGSGRRRRAAAELPPDAKARCCLSTCRADTVALLCEFHRGMLVGKVARPAGLYERVRDAAAEIRRMRGELADPRVLWDAALNNVGHHEDFALVLGWPAE